jgi:hypothetical protein
LAEQQVHVRIHGRKWAVFVAGTDAPESAHDRKVDAVAAAQGVATQRGAELVVFTLDGRPQEQDDSAPADAP